MNYILDGVLGMTFIIVPVCSLYIFVSLSVCVMCMCYMYVYSLNA